MIKIAIIKIYVFITTAPVRIRAVFLGGGKVKRSKLLISSLGLREYDQFEAAFAAYGCLTETADYRPEEILECAGKYDAVVFSFDFIPYERAKAFALELSGYDNIKLVLAVTCYTDFDHSWMIGFNDKLVLLFRPLYMNKIMDMIIKHFPGIISGCGCIKSVEERIDIILSDIGYSISQTGYFLLRDALIYMVVNDCPSASLSREIYPYLAKRFGKSAAAIEKALRSMNAKVWQSASPRMIRRFFPGADPFSDKIPGNKPVLAALAKVITDSLRNETSPR